LTAGTFSYRGGIGADSLGDKVLRGQESNAKTQTSGEILPGSHGTVDTILSAKMGRGQVRHLSGSMPIRLDTLLRGLGTLETFRAG